MNVAAHSCVKFSRNDIYVINGMAIIIGLWQVQDAKTSKYLSMLRVILETSWTWVDSEQNRRIDGMLSGNRRRLLHKKSLASADRLQDPEPQIMEDISKQLAQYSTSPNIEAIDHLLQRRD